MKRFLLALLSASLLLSLAISVVSADDWCSDDPPVAVHTPGGHTVVVKVTDYALGSQHLDALKNVTYSYVAVPAGIGSTAVTLTVLIPGDVYAATFSTRSVVSSAADENSHQYVVYSDVSGIAGTAIVHTFTLPIA